METFVGDIVELILDTKIVLTGYDVYIKYRKPSGVKGAWTGSISVDTYKVEYTTSTSDLDEAGTWKLQAYAADALGVFIGHGKVIDLEVFSPLGTLTTAAPTTAP